MLPRVSPTQVSPIHLDTSLLELNQKGRGTVETAETQARVLIVREAAV